jgi:hypothetical protein
VAEVERADYLKTVPAEALICHEGLADLPAIRTWILDWFDEDCIVQVDDDLRRVVSCITGRTITAPEAIKQLIENSLQVAEDCGIGVFCWSRTLNRTLTHPDERPFNFTAPVASVFGQRGLARHRHWDSDFPGKADYEFTLRTLMEDRILLGDNRFYFDCGPPFRGTGGNAGRITKKQIAETDRLLKERYGAAADLGSRDTYQHPRPSIGGMGIRVRRKATLH